MDLVLALLTVQFVVLLGAPQHSLPGAAGHVVGGVGHAVLLDPSNLVSRSGVGAPTLLTQFFRLQRFYVLYESLHGFRYRRPERLGGCDSRSGYIEATVGVSAQP